MSPDASAIPDGTGGGENPVGGRPGGWPDALMTVSAESSTRYAAADGSELPMLAGSRHSPRNTDLLLSPGAKGRIVLELVDGH
jgi:hypothetical protein